MTGVPEGQYVFTPHALWEMQRRGIGEQVVRAVIEAPEQRLQVRPGREVFQSRVPMGPESEIYLVRVFVDTAHGLPEVVTVYRTSKIEKYWRTTT